MRRNNALLPALGQAEPLEPRLDLRDRFWKALALELLKVLLCEKVQLRIDAKGHKPLLGLLTFLIDLRVTLPRHRLLAEQVIHSDRGSIRLAIDGRVVTAVVADDARRQMGQAIPLVLYNPNSAVSDKRVVARTDDR